MDTENEIVGIKKKIDIYIDTDNMHLLCV